MNENPNRELLARARAAGMLPQEMRRQELREEAKRVRAIMDAIKDAGTPDVWNVNGRVI